MSTPMPVYCLSLHADYACQHSGRCCSSSWPIPTSAEEFERLDSALRERRLSLPDGAGAPAFMRGDTPPTGTAAILGIRANGQCAFYDASERRCAIHRDLGQPSLPSSCQHFPRICLIDPRGTFISLSHYCPTVAGLAFRDDVVPTVVEAPDSLTQGVRLEGLDATRTLPPLLRPEMLADHGGYDAWERFAVAAMGLDLSPDEALQHVVRVTDKVTRWRPGEMSLSACVELVSMETSVMPRADMGADFEAAASLAARIAACVPPGFERPLAMGAREREAFRTLVEPEWTRFWKPVRYYLASKLFASWLAYQGQGVRSVVAGAFAALALVRVEASRLCAERGERLDEQIVREAFGAADYRLAHVGVPEMIAAAV